MLLCLLILWTFGLLLAATSAIAVLTGSRARLLAILKHSGRDAWIARFDRHRRDLALTARLLRNLCIILGIVTIGVFLPTDDPWWRHPLKLALISAVWLSLFDTALPAAWARYAGEAHLARLLPLLDLTRKVFAPLLAAFRILDEIVRRLAGADQQEAEHAALVEREILDAVSQADADGPVDETEKAMIRSVMAMDEKTAGQIMTPRTDMIAVDAKADFAEARDLVIRAAHSRIPVYEGTLDHVIGVLFAKDLLNVSDPADFSTAKLMRQAHFVPETKDVTSLLREFQNTRLHMAIVLDEYGGTAGLVTIEDILEELVGEIADEHDEPLRARIQRLDERTVEVDARVRIEELNQALGLNLPEDEAYDTVAGFVFSRLGKIPAPGESVRTDHALIHVLTATDRTLLRLRVQARTSNPAETRP